MAVGHTRSQLELVSREQADHRRQEMESQARAIAAWMEIENFGEYSVHVINSSTLPVRHLHIQAVESHGETLLGYGAAQDALPPGRQASDSPLCRAVAREVNQSCQEQLSTQNHYTPPRLRVRFVDVNNVAWIRQENGELVRASAQDERR